MLRKKAIGKVFVIGENASGYQHLLLKLHWLQEHYGTKVFYIGLEATGDYWKNLYYFLKRQSEAFVLTVINPFRTKHFAKSELRRAKTDAVDARDIALFMAEKRPPSTVDRGAIFECIKDIDGQIYSYRKQQTMNINKLRIELSKVAPELEQAKKEIHGCQILALLDKFPTAEAIAKASQAELRNLRYGKMQWRLPVKFVKELRRLCKNSIAHKTGVGSGCIVQSLVRKIVSYEEEIALLKSQLQELYQQVSDSDSLLTTIHSIGKENAIVLEAYIGDVHRFRGPKQIVAYFGMNPDVSRTGKATNRASYLQKKGSGMVRNKLFLIVISMLRHKRQPIYGYYQRLVDSGKPKLVAICAAMRKLLVIMYAMLKNQQPFDPKKNEKS